MKAKIYVSLVFVCLCLCQSVSYSQCINAGNGLFPENTFYNTNFTGVPEVISEYCYAGEFSTVHVDQGSTYVFSSSIGTDYLTIYDPDVQDVVLVSGTSPVSYQATFTGVVLFFTHVSSNCEEEQENRERIVSCTAPEPCLNAAYGQYPATTFSSSICDGVTEEVIDYDCIPNEYSKVNLLAGNTYHFSSSETDDYITISNENGTTALLAGFSPLEYVVATDQVVRFYLHTDVNCGASSIPRSRIVKCGPTFCHGLYQWPQETYSMTACNGTVENIVNDAFAGEYALVNMEMNKTYVLSSSVLTDYITVASEDDAILYTRGTTPITFSPPTSGVYRFLISTDADCGIEEVNRDRNISCSPGGVGIEEQNEFGLSIYPNPATTFVTVSAKEKMDEIQIVSVDGKILSTVLPDSINTTLSLEHLQAGTYFVRVSIDGAVMIEEVIVE